MTGWGHIVLDRPWLTLPLGAPHRVLSWALNRPGFVEADTILWREVRNADLPQDFDVKTWLCDALEARDNADAVAFLTSRDVRAFETSAVRVGDVDARCVATVGLSNAESVGTRMDRSGRDWGTINVAVQVSAALSDGALIEALSIAVQARTAAVIALGHDLPTGISTGTGTDCIAMAAPAGDIPFAGLHTDVGEAIGASVYAAVLAGGQDWMQNVRRAGVF